MRFLAVLAGTAALAACVPQRQAPPPPPQPRPAPVRPTPPPPPPPPPADWRDIPLTPGGWSYSGDGNGSQAQFGAGGASSFVIRCDRAQSRIALMRAGKSSGSVMTIRTSFGARNFPVAAGRQPVSTTVAASDRFLDSMTFSRGRFTVEAPGLPMLVIPSWAEPARVIEDCRG